MREDTDKCAKFKNENCREIEFWVHDKSKLIEEIVRDAFKFEEMLKLYKAGSKLSRAQEDIG